MAPELARHLRRQGLVLGLEQGNSMLSGPWAQAPPLPRVHTQPAPERVIESVRAAISECQGNIAHRQGRAGKVVLAHSTAHLVEQGPEAGALGP